MPHTVTYTKIESIDHIIIRFDKEGNMQVMVRARLEDESKPGKSEKYIHRHALKPGQRQAILAIVRDIGADLDVAIPLWAKEKKQ